MMGLMLRGWDFCDLIIMLLAAMFASQSFGIVSTLTLLGFIIVQYVAICKPLYHSSVLNRGKIVVFICLTWLVTLMCAIIPFLVVISFTNNSECSEHLMNIILKVIVIGANVTISLIGLIFVLIVVLCLRIYWEIHKLKRRLSQFRNGQTNAGERKAFVTIIILLVTLSSFYIPYSLVYVITMNSNSSIDMHSSALMYYMTALPYIKFFTDPLVRQMYNSSTATVPYSHFMELTKV